MQPVILIFSTEMDQAAGDVSRWLLRYGCDVVRVNYDRARRDDIDIEMTQDDFAFRAKDRWYSLSDVSAIWYRKPRGFYWFASDDTFPEVAGHRGLASILPDKLRKEELVLAQYFHRLVKRKGIRFLGNPAIVTPNKLELLALAEEVGLSVPRWRVANTLPDDVRERPDAYITKSLSDGVYLWDRRIERRAYFSYTETVADVVPPDRGRERVKASFLQEKIEKSFEVRTFFLDGSFVSAAIFSQFDLQTSTDYRKYNADRPNRVVPYTLPTDVEDKLARLFAALDLNTGSVDFIAGKAGELLFLEVNPIGIYTNISNVCNYEIDRAVARWLCGRNDDEQPSPTRAECCG